MGDAAGVEAPTVPEKVVERLTRVGDESGEGARFARSRLLRTVGGFIVVIAGCAFAFTHPDQGTLGFVVALVGAGVVEPSTIVGLIRGK